MGRASMIQGKTSVTRLGLLESIKKYRNYNAGSEFLTPEVQDYAFIRLEGSLSSSSANGGFLRIGVNGNANDTHNKVLGIAQVNWLIHNALFIVIITIIRFTISFKNTNKTYYNF